MQSDSLTMVEQHRWIVDSMEEHVASIEVDGGATVTVPQWLLPAGAREGHVLRVSHEREPAGNRSSVTIEIDDAATRQAVAESASQVRKGRRPGNDPGGDIVL